MFFIFQNYVITLPTRMIFRSPLYKSHNFIVFWATIEGDLSTTMCTSKPVFLVLAITVTLAAGCPPGYTHPQGDAQFASLKVTNSHDFIATLESLATEYPLIEVVVNAIGQRSEILGVIDRILMRWPELPKIIQELTTFFTGPEAAGLTNPIKKVLPPVVQALRLLYAKIIPPLEEAGEALTEQGIRLYFQLQTPEAIASFRKLRVLPEMKILIVYLDELGVDLQAAFDRIEAVLVDGHSLT